MRYKGFFALMTIALLTVFSMMYATPKSTPQSTPNTIRRQDCCSGENAGVIEGYVYDPDGQTVRGATVDVERTDVIVTRTFNDVSDGDGKFSIKLPPGEYLVIARKEEDGYPRTTSTFYYVNNITPPQVTVNEGQITSGVKVRLGQKVAKLMLRVYDIGTNKPIRNTRMTLRRVDNPEYSFSTSSDANGALEVSAPTSPFTIEVTAPGYQNWRYKNPNSNQAYALHLAPGNVHTMNIALRPDR